MNRLYIINRFISNLHPMFISEVMPEILHAKSSENMCVRISSKKFFCFTAKNHFCTKYATEDDSHVITVLIFHLMKRKILLRLNWEVTGLITTCTWQLMNRCFRFLAQQSNFNGTKSLQLWPVMFRKSILSFQLLEHNFLCISSIYD